MPFFYRKNKKIPDIHLWGIDTAQHENTGDFLYQGLLLHRETSENPEKNQPESRFSNTQKADKLPWSRSPHDELLQSPPRFRGH